MKSRKPVGFVTLGEPRAAQGPRAETVALDARAAGKKVALLVCHGMGQQVPFETIDAIARTLRRAHLRLAAAKTAPEVTTRIVDLGIGKPVGRAELRLTDPDAGDIDLHIYEAYWAPLPAGKVSLRQVVGFLIDAGVTGLRVTGQTFLRWMFHGWQEFERSANAFIYLAVAILFVLSLILMNATIVAVFAARGIGHDPGKWPTAELINAFTADFALLLLCWGAAALALWVAYRFHEGMNEEQLGWDRGAPRVRAGIALAFVLIWIGVLATIVIGGLLGWDLYRSAIDAPPFWSKACQGETGFPCCLTRLPNALLVAVWPLVLLVSHFIRKFMIDYLGDVVAYVNAHEVSEFYEVRQAIQKVGHDIGAAVYALRDPADPQQPFYSRVVMVGHSLGSVLAYDTLDRLLLEDSWRPQPDVLARTAALVTFGSPLDKTAFIFRSQKPVEAEVREALAAGMQPLIAEEKYRLPLKWFNLWSGQDWISGSLSYYDRNPPVEAWKVNNIEDLYANIPLLAHIMYWRSPQLASTLLHCIRL